MDYHPLEGPPHLPQQVPPPKRGPARRIVSVLLLLLSVLLCAAVVYLVWSVKSPQDKVAAGKKVSVTIPDGADAGQIGAILHEHGIIDSERIFVARLRLDGKTNSLRSGTYNLVTGSSFQDVVRVLEKGPPPAPTFELTIPEGYRLTEIARCIDMLPTEGCAGYSANPKFTGKEYMQVIERTPVPKGYGVPAGTRSLEGFMFPAKYELLQTATAGQLVQKQLEAFAATMKDIDMSAARKANLTPYDVLIIASMVEREAQVDKERTLVSAVIWNRLEQSIPLGIDATTQYAVDPDEWKQNLTQSDLAIDSPYNTRTNQGLPPTPIANPGRESIEAAANPAKVDYLYYVAKPDGSGEHFFTTSYDEFLNFQN